MRKFAFVVLVGLLSVCSASAGLSSRRKKKRRKHIARQKLLNQEFQQRFTSFVNVDALPTFPSQGVLEQVSDLRALPGLGVNAFGQELPNLGLVSPGSSFRMDGVSPFGGVSFRPRQAGFDVARPSLAPQAILRSIPTVPSFGALAGQRRGHHTSTSLPFLDTRDAGDLTYKIEAVKIAEAALKELKNSPDNSAGGFMMMKFLYKLIKRVGSRQKALVNSMLVLVSVPYFATLSSTWWMGPTTAMDITWPGAKRGITTVIEQVLKRYGRIGGAMNIQSYASQLTGGLGQLGSLPGQVSQLGNLPGQVSSQLGSLPGQVSSQLGSLPGQVSSQLGSLPGQVSNQLRGQLPRLGQVFPPR